MFDENISLTNYSHIVPTFLCKRRLNNQSFFTVVLGLSKHFFGIYLCNGAVITNAVFWPYEGAKISVLWFRPKAEIAASGRNCRKAERADERTFLFYFIFFNVTPRCELMPWLTYENFQYFFHLSRNFLFDASLSKRSVFTNGLKTYFKSPTEAQSLESDFYCCFLVAFVF